jgi:hypothetical protein
MGVDVDLDVFRPPEGIIDLHVDGLDVLDIFLIFDAVDVVDVVDVVDDVTRHG